MNPKRRLAAMDAPSEVRQVLGKLLRGAEPSTPYERLLLEAYTVDESWAPCWAAETHDHARALHAAVEALGGTGVDPEAACQKAGLTWTQMIIATGPRRLFRVGGQDQDAGPALERNWTHGGRGRQGEKRSLSLHTCTHDDCLAKKNTGKPGVLVQLLVPELGTAGLLCRSCRRMPTDTQAIFPEVYLKPWRGGRRTKIVIDGQQRWVGSHCAAT